MGWVIGVVGLGDESVGCGVRAVDSVIVSRTIGAPAVLVICNAVAASSVTAMELLKTGPKRGASVPATAASRLSRSGWRLPLRKASSLKPTLGRPVVSIGVSE